MATKITTDNIDLSADTTALEIPTGTTNQRPGIVGVEYLVVAGGGGGGSRTGASGSGSGGGGAGGLLTSWPSGTALSVASGASIDITVGEGGIGASTPNTYTKGGDGGDSIFASITATGGGGGASGPFNGNTGGSGGGSGYSGAGGNGTIGQGNNGGSASSGSAPYAAGGGGGANGVGGNAASSSVPGTGGAGLTIDITNASVTYAAGGDGCVWTDGGSSNESNNTGNGSDGAATAASGNGGSGVVILRYPDTYTIVETTSVLTFTTDSTSVANTKITTFTAGINGIIQFTGGTAAVEGTLRENTTTGKMEVYTGSPLGWRALQQTGQDVGITPSSNFNTILYNGTGSAQSLTVGFQPDLTIIKSYAGSAEWPSWFDTVRTVPGNNINSNSTNVQGTNTTTVTSFDTTGFTVGSDATWFVNKSGNSYVAWNWKAGGNANTFNKNGTGYATASAAGLTAGTITPTGSSVNTETGFSIIAYTGASTASTISHGLGITPELIFIKSLNNTGNWITYSSATGSDYYIYLNSSSPPADYPADPPWTNITSTTFGINGIFSDYNNSSTNYIAYCFASIPGYSQIGYYIGSGVASGNKIYTGFKPAWLLVRNVSTTKDWYIVDNKRSTTNPRNKELYPNSNSNEATMNSVSFFDYGFEVVTTDSGYNTIGHQYLFMAFSE